MAKEITLAQKAIMLSAGVAHRARNINRYLSSLEVLASKLKMSKEQKLMFLLCVRSIRQDCDYLAETEEE